MRIFQVAINPPSRALAPSRPRVPFYRLPSHRLPVRWYLYRNLLRSAPDAVHRNATKLRWAQAERRHCTSPAATVALLRYEHDILSDYLAYQRDPVALGQPSRDRIEAIRAQAEQRLVTERRDTETLQEYVSRRDRLYSTGLLTLHNPVQQHQALAMVPLTFQPRPTPGLVMPTLQNGPLPCLKPQPLHISMLIHRRQQSRDNRVVQQKAWEEMLYHLKQEDAFEDRHNSSTEKKDMAGKLVSLRRHEPY